MNLICKQCGKEYKADRDTRLYCSVACYNKSKHILISKTCKHCGASFSVLPHDINKRQYCSYECRHKAQEKLTIQVCSFCGKEYSINWAGNHRKYCSIECSDKAKDTRITVNCAVCGKPYLARPHNLENGLGKYCSNECRYASKRDKKVVVCKTCGKEFETVKSELTRRGGAKYCSQKCAFENPDYKAHGKSKGGKRPDLDNQYFRSSWEANYARILNHLKDNYIVKSWKYEADCFDLGFGNYYPDFKVESIDGLVAYHEVKGYKHPVGEKKIEAFRELYSDIPLTIIGEEAYKNLSAVYSKRISNWEIGKYGC